VNQISTKFELTGSYFSKPALPAGRLAKLVKKNIMSSFQIIVLSIFGVFAIVGVALFASFTGGAGLLVEEINIWGSVENIKMQEFLISLREVDESFEKVKYTEIEPFEFDEVLTEALATGTGPDIFMLPQKSILKHKAKIFPIPYEAITERSFKDKYVEEGELLLSPEGILGLPFFIDPMVMYWNRDIFSSAGVAAPPKKWEEFFALSQKITEKDANFNVMISLISFGEFRNLNHAKDIISMLMMQADSIMTEFDSKGNLDIKFNKTSTGKIDTIEEAVNFFVQFSNPSKSVYTWNRSLPNSEDAFISNKLALYLGYASEIKNLRKKNPNLNFDVTYMPQADTGKSITFGNLTSLVIAKNSRKIESAFKVINAMTTDSLLAEISRVTELPPTSRILLSEKPQNPYADVFYGSSLISKAWLDPNPAGTDVVFRNMIDSIISGREKVANAINRAVSETKQLIQ